MVVEKPWERYGLCSAAIGAGDMGVDLPSVH